MTDPKDNLLLTDTTEVTTDDDFVTRIAPMLNEATEDTVDFMVSMVASSYTEPGVRRVRLSAGRLGVADTTMATVLPVELVQDLVTYLVNEMLERGICFAQIAVDCIDAFLEKSWEIDAAERIQSELTDFVHKDGRHAGHVTSFTFTYFGAKESASFTLSTDLVVDVDTSEQDQAFLNDIGVDPDTLPKSDRIKLINIHTATFPSYEPL